MQWRTTYTYFIFLLMVVALVLLSNQPAHADPSDEERINTFSISPNPQQQGANVTMTVNFEVDEVDSDGNNYTHLCIYEPNTNAPSTNPTTFTLPYYSGMSQVNVTFTETAQGVGAPTCPARSGQTGVLYRSGAIPSSPTTFDGLISWPIYSGAATGTYNWSLLIEEPVGTPNPLTTSHTIAAPTAINLQSAAATSANAPTVALMTLFVLVGTGTVLALRRRLFEG